MKRFLLSLLSCFAIVANAQIPHVVPLKSILLDGTANWQTGVGGYIRADNNGGHINTSSSGGYIHTFDSGGSISTAHHGGYVSTNYGGGAIYTGGTGGGIWTNNLGGSINTLNSGGTIDTSSSGAGIVTSGYHPSTGWGLIYNGWQFIPQVIPAPTPPSSSIVCLASMLSYTYSASLNKINFPTVVKDSNGWWDSTNHRFTPTTAGYYQILFVLCGDFGTKQLQLEKNGSILAIPYLTATGNASTFTSLTFIVYANGTDYFEMFINPYDGPSSVSLYGGTFSTAPTTYFSITPLP